MEGTPQTQRFAEFDSANAAVMEHLKKTQKSAIISAGNAIYKAIKAGHRFFVTGTGHSHMMAEEFYTRAGVPASVGQKAVRHRRHHH